VSARDAKDVEDVGHVGMRRWQDQEQEADAGQASVALCWIQMKKPRSQRHHIRDEAPHVG